MAKYPTSTQTKSATQRIAILRRKLLLLLVMEILAGVPAFIRRSLAAALLVLKQLKSKAAGSAVQGDQRPVLKRSEIDGTSVELNALSAG